jgi:hypothetical protein
LVILSSFFSPSREILLKPLEVVIPEPLVMREPVPHRTEPRGDQMIAPLSAMPLLRHETGIKQDAQVLRDGWAAHREMSRNRVDRAVGLDEEIEHPATRGMANCPKDILLAIGSHHHAANIRKEHLTRQDAPERIRRIAAFGEMYERSRAKGLCGLG